MKMYDLNPTDGRKSFYGKAKVEISPDGTETLYSYNTAIIKKIAGRRSCEAVGRVERYYRAAYFRFLRIE